MLHIQYNVPVETSTKILLLLKIYYWLDVYTLCGICAIMCTKNVCAFQFILSELIELADTNNHSLWFHGFTYVITCIFRL